MKTILLFLCLLLLSASTSLALKINDDAPLFSLRDSNGSFFYLSDYIGAKKKKAVTGVIVNFFAPTCVPCKDELPVLNSLVPEFEKKGVKVVIIGYREDFDAISGMLDALKVNNPVILSDPYGKVGQNYGVIGLPLTVFIGSDSKVKDIIRGELPNIGKVIRDKAARLFK